MSVFTEACADGSSIWSLLLYTLEFFISLSIHVEMYSADFGSFLSFYRKMLFHVCAMCLYILFSYRSYSPAGLGE